MALCLATQPLTPICTASATREFVGRSSDNDDPNVRPLIAQLTPDCQPVLTSEVKVECYNVNLVVQEQFQGLRGRSGGPDDLEVRLIGKPARQRLGKGPDGHLSPPREFASLA